MSAKLLILLPLLALPGCWESSREGSSVTRETMTVTGSAAIPAVGDVPLNLTVTRTTDTNNQETAKGSLDLGPLAAAVGQAVRTGLTGAWPSMGPGARVPDDPNPWKDPTKWVEVAATLGILGTTGTLAAQKAKQMRAVKAAKK